MTNNDVVPELKQILGAMIFGAGRALTVKELRKCMVEVGETGEGHAALFGKVSEKDVEDALEMLQGDLSRLHGGLLLNHVAGGLRFQTDAACGVWLKHLLDAGKPQRLSRPALETLAIIAYRQPISKAEIEGVRGVNVDHMMKSLMELQLIKISGRSELPGRPFQYGTTQLFLEHFGLKSLDDLKAMEPMLVAGNLRKAEKEHVEVAVPVTVADELKGPDGPPTEPVLEDDRTVAGETDQKDTEKDQDEDTEEDKEVEETEKEEDADADDEEDDDSGDEEDDDDEDDEDEDDDDEDDEDDDDDR